MADSQTPTTPTGRDGSSLRITLMSQEMLGCHRGLQDHRSIRILEIVVSGIPFVLGLTTRMQDPDVYVVFGGLDI